MSCQSQVISNEYTVSQQAQPLTVTSSYKTGLKKPMSDVTAAVSIFLSCVSLKHLVWKHLEKVKAIKLNVL